MFNFETIEMSAQQVTTCWSAAVLTNAEDDFFRTSCTFAQSSFAVCSATKSNMAINPTSITHANKKKRKNPQQITYNIMATEEEKI